MGIEEFLDVADLEDKKTDGIKGWSWKVYQEGSHTYVEFQQYSPEGEDFIMDIWGDTIDEFLGKLRSYYHDFEPEEHAAEWYKANRGEPSSLRALLDDADSIKKMIEKLLVYLVNFKENNNYKR